MTEKNYKNDHFLIETDELEAVLGVDDLRIVDCNVIMNRTPDGVYKIKSGRENYDQFHIPGSVFLDLVDDLSDKNSPLRFMMPSEQTFAKVVGMAGICNQTKVVLYSQGANYWATRLFLMFRAFGHDNCQVLNGGWDKWFKEGRAVDSIKPDYPERIFSANLREGQIIGKQEVLDAMKGDGLCMINALSPDIFSGKTFNPAYSRPGHILGSVNLYALELINESDNTFIDSYEMEKKFESLGVYNSKKVITYCGGGISATTNMFALLLLGLENVSLYDGSLTEWGPDINLPMEVSEY